MQIEAYRDRCIASGACVLAAPDVFDQDDDGIVVVLVPEPGPDLAEVTEDAVRACPAAVLRTGA